MHLIFCFPIFIIVAKGLGRLNQILVAVCILICANVCFCSLNNTVISELLLSAIAGFPKNFYKDTSGFVELIQNIDAEQNSTTYCFADDNLTHFYRGSDYALYKEDTIDENKHWIRISNESHHSFFMYEEWENQTIILLKRHGHKNMSYSVFKLYMREAFGRAVYEWDMWKPKEFESTSCQCSLVSKFFHPCSNWEYCALPYSLKAKPEITSSEENEERVCQVRDNFGTSAENNSATNETDNGSGMPSQNFGFVNEYYYEETTLRPALDSYPRINETYNQYGPEMQFQPVGSDFIAEMNEKFANIPANIMRTSLLGKKKRDLSQKYYSEVPMGCMYSFGPFFGDILDDKNSAEHIGKAIARKRSDLPTFDSFKPKFPLFLPFVGFMDCRFKILSYEKVKNSTNFADVVAFFTSTIRAQCLMESIKGDLMKIFQTRLVILTPGLKIQPNIKQHLLYTERLINKQEENLLETAFYFSAYSQIYPRLLSEMKNNANESFVATTGLRISRNTRMITYLVLWVYDVVQKSLPFHTIKFFRNMISLLRNNFLLRLQEKADLIFRCPNYLNRECSEQIARNTDCRIQIMALIQFIVFGTNPLKEPKEDSSTRFTKFYNLHKKFIVKQVSLYDVFLKTNIRP